MRIILIGAGNVAQHLGPAFHQAGHTLPIIYSRQLKNAQKLAQNIPSAQAQDHLDFSETKADLAILCIKDDAIPEVLLKLKLDPAILLVHTSGSQPLSILSEHSPNIGVFYPLQTFSPEKEVDFSTLPLFLELKDSCHQAALDLLARDLSPKIFWLSSEQRKKLHIAAVFANNFTNWMLVQSQVLLQENKLPVNTLDHLIRETFEKALRLPPPQAQTGPARRGDRGLIEQHLDLLKDDPLRREIYQKISEHILQYFKGDPSH